MLNNTTGAILLHGILSLMNTRGPVPQNITVTLLEDSITDPLFENETMKCYGMYGCFSLIGPWKDLSRPVSNFPEHPLKLSPRYCLHTRYNPTECQYLDFMNRNSIYGSLFIPYHKTYFVAHGFLETGEKEWMKNISKSLLKLEDANVILVDWGNGSLPPYTQAVANIRLVGRITALLIYSLKILTGVNTEDIHLIGHSLGAHLSGYVGHTLRYNLNCKLGRITGLDPAQPHFKETDPVVRLDTSDALFVDIIHTNAKPFMSGGFGLEEPIGHLDFYPNNGDNQPGCTDGMMTFVNNEDESVYRGLRRYLSCDHIRSHEFLLESLTSRKYSFLGVECDSWEKFLGGHCFPCKSDKNSNGFFCASLGLESINDWKNSEFAKQNSITPVKLYTITNSKLPFCLALYRITLTISNSSASTQHKGEIGVFSISISGSEGRTSMTETSKELHFAPATSYQHVIGGKYVGKISTATLRWEHKTTFSVITWRIDPIIHVGSVIVETFQDNQRLHLCPLRDEVLSSRGTMKLKLCST